MSESIAASNVGDVGNGQAVRRLRESQQQIETSEEESEDVQLSKSKPGAPIAEERTNRLSLISTAVLMKVWVWDKNAGHKLFNFHDGYRVLPAQRPLIGSCIISRAKNGLIKIQKARELHSLPIKPDPASRSSRTHHEAERKKLLNLVFHSGSYFVSEPNGDTYVPRDPDLVIEKHCWLIVKFLDGKRTKLSVNDVVRFGRVSFKVTELAITKDEIAQAQKILDWAKNNTDFQIQANSLPQEQGRGSEADYQPAELNLGPDRQGNASRLTFTGEVSLVRERSNFSLNEQMLGNASQHSNLQRLENLNRNPESTLFNMTNLNQSGSGLNLLQSNINNSLNHSLSLDRQGMLKNQSKDILQPIDFSLGRHNLTLSQNGLRGNVEERPETHESGVRACRICLEEEEDLKEGNPFITPCKCTGSMGYIHLKCLRDWTDSKKQAQQEEGVSSYYWENLICELCKSPLNLVVQSVSRPGYQQFLLEIDRPKDDPYMVLESDIECPSKAIHVINLRIKPICSVGRRVNNEISISDISVSRRQAEFTLVGNEIFVQDQDSKFGTFKKLTGLTKLDKEQFVMPIQIEKKCFFFKVLERFSASQKCKFCCMRSYPRESYDHFANVYDRFPLNVQRSLLPPSQAKQKEPVSAAKAFGNNRVRNDDSIVNDFPPSRLSVSAISEAQENGPGRHVRSHSATLHQNGSDLRPENSDRHSMQERRENLPLQRIDEASDHSGAHPDDDEVQIPQAINEESGNEDDHGSHLNPLEQDDPLPANNASEELAIEEFKVDSPLDKPGKLRHSVFQSNDLQRGLGIQDTNFTNSPTSKKNFQSRFASQRNEPKAEPQPRNHVFATHVSPQIQGQQIEVNASAERYLRNYENGLEEPELIDVHRLQKLSKLQHQRQVEPDPLDEQRPLARSVFVVADYTQGQQIDGLSRTRKDIIKRALESAEYADRRTELAGRAETIVMIATDNSLPDDKLSSERLRDSKPVDGHDELIFNNK